jgi:dsRNA-specific ribonuclease
MKLEINIQEAKQAIAIPDFKRDSLLRIALIEPADLMHLDISRDERDRIERYYRQLAFLGDSLLDAVLADYLLRCSQNLTKKDLNRWRETIASRSSCCKFAIKLGLPQFSSSWRKKRKPEEKPGLWGEMFEVVVAVIFIDSNRDFVKLSSWLVNSFIRDAICAEINH